MALSWQEVDTKKAAFHIIKSFSPEWQEVIRICFLYPDAFMKAHNCITKLHARFKASCFHQGLHAFQFLDWTDLIDDLMETTVTVSKGKLDYVSRFFLLPLDARKNLIMLVVYNKNCICRSVYEKFGTFLRANFEHLGAWSQFLVRKHYALEYLQYDTNEMYLNECKISSTLNDKTLHQHNADHSECSNGNVKLERYKIVLSTEAESYLRTLANQSVEGETDSKEFIEQKEESRCFTNPVPPVREVNQSCRRLDINFGYKPDDLIFFETAESKEEKVEKLMKSNNEPDNAKCQVVERNPESSGLETMLLHMPLKKRKLEAVGEGVNDDTTYKTISTREGSLQEISFPDHDVKKLKQILQTNISLPLVCEKILKMAKSSHSEPENICLSLVEDYQEEKEVLTFIKCIESDILNFSSTVREKIIDKSLFVFLLNTQRPVSRNLDSYLFSRLIVSKDHFIKFVLIPLLLHVKERTPQENILLNILDSKTMETEDYSLILDKTVNGFLKEEIKVNVCVIRCLATILKKMTTVSKGTISSIILILKRDEKHLIGSLEVPKLVILLFKQYKNSVSSLLSDIDFILQSNKTFLKKAAMNELKKLTDGINSM